MTDSSSSDSSDITVIEVRPKGERNNQHINKTAKHSRSSFSLVDDEGYNTLERKAKVLRPSDDFIKTEDCNKEQTSDYLWRNGIIDSTSSDLLSSHSQVNSSTSGDPVNSSSYKVKNENVEADDEFEDGEQELFDLREFAKTEREEIISEPDINCSDTENNPWNEATASSSTISTSTDIQFCKFCIKRQNHPCNTHSECNTLSDWDYQKCVKCTALYENLNDSDQSCDERIKAGKQLLSIHKAIQLYNTNLGKVWVPSTSCFTIANIQSIMKLLKTRDKDNSSNTSNKSWLKINPNKHVIEDGQYLVHIATGTKSRIELDKTGTKFRYCRKENINLETSQSEVISMSDARAALLDAINEASLLSTPEPEMHIIDVDETLYTKAFFKYFQEQLDEPVNFKEWPESSDVISFRFQSKFEPLLGMSSKDWFDFCNQPLDTTLAIPSAMNLASCLSVLKVNEEKRLRNVFITGLNVLATLDATSNRGLQKPVFLAISKMFMPMLAHCAKEWIVHKYKLRKKVLTNLKNSNIQDSVINNLLHSSYFSYHLFQPSE